MICGIRAIKPEPSNVMTCIDGDDQLVGRDSLDLVADAYVQTDCLLTHGSDITSQGHRQVHAYERRPIRDN